MYKLFILAVAVGFSAVVMPFFLPKTEDKKVFRSDQPTDFGKTLNIPSPQAINKVASSIDQRESNIKVSDQTTSSSEQSAEQTSESHNQPITSEASAAGSNDKTVMPYEVELPAKDLEAVIETNLGNIRLRLFTLEAPKTVANFYELARQGFYDGIAFHRIIKDFMIQTGDPLSKDEDPSNDGTGGPGYNFSDEINNFKLTRGKLAMANSGPNTNGSQFFIVTAKETSWLDGKHTVFGEVIEGLEVVDAIAQVETDEADRPKEKIIIKSIKIISEEDAQSQTKNEQDNQTEEGEGQIEQ